MNHVADREGSDDQSRQIAERLFEAFRSIAPISRNPGFGSGVRRGEFQLMHCLAHESGGLRVGDLAARLGVRPPTASQLLDTLVERGLVERYADEHDRRAIRVRLSPQGRAQAAQFRERALNEVEAVVEFMGVDDSRRLAELLTKASGFMVERHGYACRGRCHQDAEKESNTPC